MAELILPLPPVDRGTHRSRAMPMTPPPPLPSTPMTWSTSARVRSRGWPLRASDPMASTQRGPPPRLGPVTPRDGHQPPTTFHVGPTARVTSWPAVTTATGVPIHDPTLAAAVTGPVAGLRALSAAPAEGEDVCVRSPPAYTVATGAGREPGAPLTRTPDVGAEDGAALPDVPEEDVAGGDPDGAGDCEVQAESTTATAAVTRS